MRSIFVSFLIIIFSVVILDAQEKKLMIAKFNDGSVYLGKLTNHDNSKVSLKLITGDTIHFNRLMAKEIRDSDNSFIYKNGKYHNKEKYFWSFGFGLNAQALFGDDDRISTHLELLFGERFSKRLSIAVGLGFEFNEASVSGFDFDTQFSSIFAYSRYYLNDNKRRLFLYTRIGYGSPTTEEEFVNDHTGGAQFQYGGGLHFASRDNSKFILSIGHHLQKTEGSESFIDLNGNEVLTVFDILIKRAIIKFSWEF